MPYATAARGGTFGVIRLVAKEVPAGICSKPRAGVSLELMCVSSFTSLEWAALEIGEARPPGKRSSGRGETWLGEGRPAIGSSALLPPRAGADALRRGGWAVTSGRSKNVFFTVS